MPFKYIAKCHYLLWPKFLLIKTQQKTNTTIICQSFYIMDRFRQTRRQSLQRKQTKQVPSAFSLPSPQRKMQQKDYGQGSVQSPIPSGRIVESILQKQVNNARKFEQVQQKLRQKQVAYRHLSDLYDKSIKQKQGIQISLTKQIDMYKQLSKQTQKKAQQRLLQIQKAFKQQMQRKLRQKQQQLLKTLQEKQELQSFVNELEKIGDQLQLKLSHTEANLQKTQDLLAKTEEEKNNFMGKLEAVEEDRRVQGEKFQALVDKLKQDVMNTQREWRDRIDQAGKQKQRSLKQLQKQHKKQLQKQLQKAELQKQSQKAQLQSLISNIQSQKTRLNEQLQQKQKHIQQLHQQSKDNNDKLNNAIRGYEQQITALATEKARLFEEVDKLNSQNTHLNVLIKEVQMGAASEKKNLQAYILKLKDEVNYSQTSFLRQRDRNIITYQDTSKQLIALKRELTLLQSQNQSLKQQSSDSHLLSQQVRKLRDMLLQSSYELQKCKGQFVRISKQRDLLGIRLGQASYQVGALRTIKREKQEEARGWRDSYYLNRSRSIRR